MEDTLLPLVTIGASNYNNAKYVIETLESIKNQSYPNIELIVTDDCSTDDSPQRIKEWLKNYTGKYTFIENEKNIGLPAVLNKLINTATGKYISEIATDDLMMPDKIKIQVELMEKAPGNVCGIYSDSYLVDENGAPKAAQFIKLGKLKTPPEGNIYEAILSGNLWFHYSAAMIKTDCYRAVGPFDENLVGEDTDMLLRLARKYSFIFSGYISEKYRVRGNSLTHTTNWYPSQLEIFSKNIPYSKIALFRLDAAAASAYIQNDIETLNLLPRYKGKSGYIQSIIVIRKLKMPIIAGRVVLRIIRFFLFIFRSCKVNIKHIKTIGLLCTCIIPANV
ncbi:MAG: glycosyltransferase family 2 protein [Bacteroidia bacterium]